MYHYIGELRHKPGRRQILRTIGRLQYATIAVFTERGTRPQVGLGTIGAETRRQKSDYLTNNHEFWSVQERWYFVI